MQIRSWNESHDNEKLWEKISEWKQGNHYTDE